MALSGECYIYCTPGRKDSGSYQQKCVICQVISLSLLFVKWIVLYFNKFLFSSFI